VTTISYGYLDWDDLTVDLVGLLMAAPDGLVREEIAAGLNLSIPQVHTLLHKARRTLGETENVNIISECLPGPTWVYRLVGDPSDAEEWRRSRLRNVRTTLVTTAAVLDSTGRGLDKRSAEGRMYKTIALSTRHLIETVDNELNGAGG
jgi:hypothetical protein